MYKITLRNAETILENIATPNPIRALEAWRGIRENAEHDGGAVVLQASKSNRIFLEHRFDSAPGDDKYVSPEADLADTFLTGGDIAPEKKRGRPATGRADTVRVTIYLEQSLNKHIREKIAEQRISLTDYFTLLAMKDFEK